MDSLARATRDGLRRAGTHAFATLKGERGRGLQVVFIMGCVCLLFLLSIWEIALVGMAIGALTLFAGARGQSSATPASASVAPTGPAPASPPPLPPPLTSRPVAQRAGLAAPVVLERDREGGIGRFFRWVFVVALVGVAAITFTAAVAWKAVDRLWMEVVDGTPWDGRGARHAREILPPARVDREKIRARADASARGLADQINKEVQEEIKAAVKDPTVQQGVKIARDAIALVSQTGEEPSVAEGDNADPTTVVVYEPGGTLSVPKAGITAAFLTEEFSTKQEADVALLHRVSDFLALALASSGKPFEIGAWRPDPDWTAAHFASDRIIHSAQDEQNGVTLFTGEVRVPTPNDARIDQIWQRFLQDQGDARSWELGLSYAGAVSVIGALAIFLRLGTSRHVRPDEVTYPKKRWFRGKRDRR